MEASLVNVLKELSDLGTVSNVTGITILELMEWRSMTEKILTGIRTSLR